MEVEYDNCIGTRFGALADAVPPSSSDPSCSTFLFGKDVEDEASTDIICGLFSEKKCCYLQYSNSSDNGDTITSLQVFNGVKVCLRFAALLSVLSVYVIPFDANIDSRSLVCNTSSECSRKTASIFNRMRKRC